MKVSRIKLFGQLAFCFIPVYMGGVVSAWGSSQLNYGGEEFFVEFHGFVDLVYEDFQKDGKGVSSQEGVSTFDNHHTNLFTKAQIREDLSFVVEVEYEHGGNAERSGGSVEIDRSEVVWKIHPELSVKFGLFYAPFGIERFTWYAPTNKLVLRPAPFRNIVPGNWYESGVGVEGVIPIGKTQFKYEVAAVNGLGNVSTTTVRGARQTRDNNSNTALVGRIGFMPFKMFEIGISGYTGKYDDQAQFRLSYWGVDLFYQVNDFVVKGEYVQSEIEDPTGGFDRKGFYIEGARAFLKEKFSFETLEAAIRFDQIDPNDTLADNTDQSRWNLGLNLAPAKHFLFKINYITVHEKNGPNLRNNGFMLMAVIDF